MVFCKKSHIFYILRKISWIFFNKYLQKLHKKAIKLLNYWSVYLDYCLFFFVFFATVGLVLYVLFFICVNFNFDFVLVFYFKMLYCLIFWISMFKINKMCKKVTLHSSVCCPLVVSCGIAPEILHLVDLCLKMREDDSVLLLTGKTVSCWSQL